MQETIEPGTSPVLYGAGRKESSGTGLTWYRLL